MFQWQEFTLRNQKMKHQLSDTSTSLWSYTTTTLLQQQASWAGTPRQLTRWLLIEDVSLSSCLRAFSTKHLPPFVTNGQLPLSSLPRLASGHPQVCQLTWVEKCQICWARHVRYGWATETSWGRCANVYLRKRLQNLDQRSIICNVCW